MINFVINFTRCHVNRLCHFMQSISIINNMSMHAHSIMKGEKNNKMDLIKIVVTKISPMSIKE